MIFAFNIILSLLSPSIFALYTQLPKYAKTMSSSVQMASAYPNPLFVTKITTAPMVQTSYSVSNRHATPGPSSVTTLCASHCCGAVTGMSTAVMGRMSGLKHVMNKSQKWSRSHVVYTSSNALTGSASIGFGAVTTAQTVMTVLMRSTAVSILFSVSKLFIIYCIMKKIVSHCILTMAKVSFCWLLTKKDDFVVTDNINACKQHFVRKVYSQVKTFYQVNSFRFFKCILF